MSRSDDDNNGRRSAPRWSRAASQSAREKTPGLRPAGVRVFAASEIADVTPTVDFLRATLPDFPDLHEKWMHDQFIAAGVAVAGVDVGESYGSPRGRKIFDEFYEELTGKQGFAKAPVPLCAEPRRSVACELGS